MCFIVFVCSLCANLCSVLKKNSTAKKVQSSLWYLLEAQRAVDSDAALHGEGEDEAGGVVGEEVAEVLREHTRRVHVVRHVDQHLHNSVDF